MSTRPTGTGDDLALTKGMAARTLILILALPCFAAFHPFSRLVARQNAWQNTGCDLR
ncbi:MAG: hypothetical protein LW715_11600 [Rhodobacter sp.]|nr:hypothetical protein [Rhodobacter sp.]MCE2749377.1 hypothetical protein [Rhodobacter sp.]